jgi:hypothetical protein
MLMFRLFPNLRTPRRPAKQCEVEAERYALALLAWLRASQRSIELPWYMVVNKSYVFAEETDREPITEMTLAKALERLGVGKRWRYLKPNEWRYRDKCDLGQTRPRILMIEVGTVLRHASMIEGR